LVGSSVWCRHERSPGVCGCRAAPFMLEIGSNATDFMLLGAFAVFRFPEFSTRRVNDVRLFSVLDLKFLFIRLDVMVVRDN
jgi:hypothetical protein